MSANCGDKKSFRKLPDRLASQLRVYHFSQSDVFIRAGIIRRDEVRGEPLERAKKRPSPADERGVRKTKLFQGLTPDYGHPKLKEHLAGVTTALKLAKLQDVGWDQFLALLDKTHPKFKPMPLFDNLGDQ